MTSSETQSPAAMGPELSTLRPNWKLSFGRLGADDDPRGDGHTPPASRPPGQGQGRVRSEPTPLPLTRVCLSVGDDRARTLSLGHTLSRRSCSIWEGKAQTLQSLGGRVGSQG